MTASYKYTNKHLIYEWAKLNATSENVVLVVLINSWADGYQAVEAPAVDKFMYKIFVFLYNRHITDWERVLIVG